MQSKMIAYDPLTGEIRGICLTQPQVMAWQTQGLDITDGADEVDLATHRVMEGQVVAKTVVELVPDKSEFIAGGEEQAVVTVAVAGEEPPASIEVLVADAVQVVDLAAGFGQTLPITAPLPTTIEVRVADQLVYLDNGGCVITAGEEEAGG
ncbi:hypothetical protein KKG48_04205 [Patescibacteria group bacterium]|nr:hypothetical protein [Pseudomonadota bacterium]MBU4381560.1 hypothetical protein [Pseudomonadota bacterium]MBU4480613.1 hypothetical protein [Patescibacteria group bacterium]MCG2766546.1 hypothetical protein [Desulfarculaceae bacterium]